jgi:hypothetical protein
MSCIEAIDSICRLSDTILCHKYGKDKKYVGKFGGLCCMVFDQYYLFYLGPPKTPPLSSMVLVLVAVQEESIGDTLPAL